MPPTWLVVVAWCALAIAFASAGIITVDIFVLRYRQPMRVMEAVWPITALYFGPFALWVYWRYARRTTRRWLDAHALIAPPDHPKWVTTAIGVSHCGAGCTLGDIIAEFVIFALALQLLGSMLLAEYVGDYTAALALGILFQYWALAPMRGLNFRDGIRAAAKADVLSLTAFEVGLFGWMAIMVLIQTRWRQGAPAATNMPTHHYITSGSARRRWSTGFLSSSSSRDPTGYSACLRIGPPWT